MKRSAIGRRSRRSETFSGPPTPWYSLSPRSWSSDCLKYGSTLGVAPAAIAERRPVVVVLVLPAHVQQPVQRARSAEHPAARPLDAASRDRRIRLGEVAPVELRVVHRLEVADRHVQPQVAVGAAGLEQQHARASVGGQAVREHAARRARADDDVVERGRRRSRDDLVVQVLRMLRLGEEVPAVGERGRAPARAGEQPRQRRRPPTTPHASSSAGNAKPSTRTRATARAATAAADA